MTMTRQRALDAGVADRVHVHLCDYRELPQSFEHVFDTAVTCEMIEVSNVVFFFDVIPTLCALIDRPSDPDTCPLSSAPWIGH